MVEAVCEARRDIFNKDPIPEIKYVPTSDNVYEWIV